VPEGYVPKGYVIVTEVIHDPAAMEEYAKLAGPSLAEHDATVLVADENVEILEGGWHGERTVVLEFESVEKARQWYDSAGYRAARPVRQAAADSNVAILSGFLPRPG
jgi:uncharacterized protein (DUF1330 family)